MARGKKTNGGDRVFRDEPVDLLQEAQVLIRGSQCGTHPSRNLMSAVTCDT